MLEFWNIETKFPLWINKERVHILRLYLYASVYFLDLVRVYVFL